MNAWKRKKLLATFLALAIIFATDHIPMTVSAESSTEEQKNSTGITVMTGESQVGLKAAQGAIDISNQYVIIDSSNLSVYNNKTVTGTKTDIKVGDMRMGDVYCYGWIVVKSGVTLNLSIEDLDIEFSTTAPFSGIVVEKGAVLNLTLKGQNTLIGTYGGCGINVPEGAVLNITKESTGTLTAKGGDYYGGGAGIGALGNQWNPNDSGITTQTCGTISIAGGIVQAAGGTQYYHGMAIMGAAGIGGSATGAGGTASTGKICITGGTVDAVGGYSATGIGGGWCDCVEEITITGGTVTATAGDFGAGIGSGYNGKKDGTVSCGKITIGGGTVTSNGNIGFGKADKPENNEGGSVTISGGTVELIGGAIEADTKNIGEYILYSYTIQFAIHDETITGNTGAKPVVTIGSGANAYTNNSADWIYEEGKASATITFKSLLHGEQPVSASMGGKNYEEKKVFLGQNDKVSWGDERGLAVSQVSGCSYTYTGGSLVFSGTGSAAVTMMEGVSASTDNIIFAKDASIELTIRDLNLTAKEGTNVIKIDDAAGNCTIRIEGNNTLSSGNSYMAVIHAGDSGVLSFDGGGILNVNHSKSRGVGIGGNYKEQSNITLTFNGNPSITVSCSGPYSICIGTPYDIENAEITLNSSSQITINSGIITAKNSGNYSIGIGGRTVYQGRNKTTINGGTVYAEGGKNDTKYGGFLVERVNVIISGGSLCNNSQVNKLNDFDKQPKDKSGTRLYVSAITVGTGANLSKNAKVSGLSIKVNNGNYDYSTTGMYTDASGKLYLWLPEGAVVSQVITENGSYTGSCTTNAEITAPGAIYGTAAATFRIKSGSDFYAAVKDIAFSSGYSPKGGVNDLSSAVVLPDNASNQTIIWSVADAGTTGAAIDGSKLTLDHTGTYTIRATVKNGKSASEDFTKDFTFTLSQLPVVIMGQGAEGAVYGYTPEDAPYVYVNAAAADSGDTISYQWYRAGTGGNGADELLDGATDRVYILPQGKDGGDYPYYCKVTCNGYTVKSDTVEVHIGKFVDGICTICGELDPNYLEENADGYYELDRAGKLLWFAAYVNTKSAGAKACLTADIDMTGKTWTTIRSFSGTLDGQGFTISKTNHLFVSSLENGGTIKNLTIHEQSFCPDSEDCGGIVGTNSGTIEKCVVSNPDIQYSGWAGFGGIAGSNTETGVIQNCAVTGGRYMLRYSASDPGTGNSMGGICGQNSGTVENCFVNGTQLRNGNIRSAIVYQAEEGHAPINCYYYIPDNTNTVQYGIEASEGGTVLTATQFENGEAAWMLNTDGGSKANSGIWSQSPTQPIFANEANKAVYRVHITGATDREFFLKSGDTFTVPETIHIPMDSITFPTTGGSNTTPGTSQTATEPVSFVVTQDQELSSDMAIKSVTPTVTDAIRFTYEVKFKNDTYAVPPTLTVSMGNRTETLEGTIKDTGDFLTASYRFYNILPQQMAENVSAILMVNENTYAKKSEYSVKTYAFNRLLASEDDTFKRFLVNMLYYGAAAQQHLGQTGNLATDGLSDLIGEEYITSCRTSDTTWETLNPESVKNVTDNNENDLITWKSATLVFDTTITMRLRFTASTENVKSLSESWFWVNGDTSVTFRNAVLESTNGNTNTYRIDVKGFIPTKYDTPVTVVCQVDDPDGDSQNVSETITYSVMSYIANMKNSIRMKNLVRALYDYGDSAKTYVKSLGVQ